MSDSLNISGGRFEPHETEQPNLVSQEPAVVRINASEVGALNTAEPPLSQLASNVLQIQDAQIAEPRLRNLQPQLNASPQVLAHDVLQQPSVDLPKKEHPDVQQPPIQVDPSVSHIGQKRGPDVPKQPSADVPEKDYRDVQEHVPQVEGFIREPKMQIASNPEPPPPPETTELTMAPRQYLVSEPKQLPLEPPALTVPTPPPLPRPNLPHFPASKVRRNQARPPLPPFQSRTVRQTTEYIEQHPPRSQKESLQNKAKTIRDFFLPNKALSDVVIPGGVVGTEVALAPTNVQKAHRDLSQFMGGNPEQFGTDAAGALGSVTGFAADAYNLRGLVRDRREAREIRADIKKTSDDLQSVIHDLTQKEAEIEKDFAEKYKKEIRAYEQLKSEDPARAKTLNKFLVAEHTLALNDSVLWRYYQRRARELDNNLLQLQRALLLAKDASTKEIGIQGTQTFLSGSSTVSSTLNTAAVAVTSLSTVAGIAGGALSTVSMPLDVREAKNTIQEAKKLKTVRQKVKSEMGKLDALSQQVRTPKQKAEDREDGAFLAMLNRKLPVTEKLISFGNQVTKVQAGLTGGAALGVKIAAATGVTTAAAGAAGAALTPVGAALGGAVVLGGLGYGGYKVGRWERNKRLQVDYAQTLKSLSQPGTQLDGTAGGRLILGKLRKDQPGLFGSNGNPLDPGTVKQEMLDLAAAGFMRHNSVYALSVMTNRIASEYDRQNYDSSAGQYNGGDRTWALMRNLGVNDQVLMQIAEAEKSGDSQTAAALLRRYLNIA